MRLAANVDVHAQRGIQAWGGRKGCSPQWPLTARQQKHVDALCREAAGKCQTNTFTAPGDEGPGAVLLRCHAFVSL